MAMTASTSITTSSYEYDSLFGTSTSSSTAASYTGSEQYPVFPNGVYISRFYLVSSQDSGLTDLDTDLFDACYLPFNPSRHYNLRRDDATTTISPKPTYLINEAPCKRQAAINTNCRFQDTNGTFSGLQEYSGDWDVQQQCYCDIYPFFDSAAGCQECFKKHGGIEGYHWFPESYMNGVSSAYCSANPQTTGFYPFAEQWSKKSAASVPTTTAVDSLGTQTAASLYYTYAAESTATSVGSSAVASTRLSLRRALIAVLPLALILSQ